MKYQLTVKFATAPNERQLRKASNRIGYWTTSEGDSKAKLTVKGNIVTTNVNLEKGASVEVFKLVDNSLSKVLGYKSMGFTKR